MFQPLQALQASCTAAFQRIVPMLLAPMLLHAAPAPAAPATGETADTLYLADHVITLDDAVSGNALAVRGERILWVGDAAEAAAVQGPRTRVVDLGAAAILPGFIDAHGHATFSAITVRVANVASPPVGPVTDIAGLQRTLADFIADSGAEPGRWIIGMGYDESLLTEGRHPDRDDLDAVSEVHPIALLHVSGHLATANSLALARAGIAAESPDPPGGLIRRRPDSREPNGVLEETATYSVRRFLREVSTDPMADLAAALERYAREGITTVQDGATNPEGAALLQAMAAAGRLSLDVFAYPVGQADPASTLAAYPWGETAGRLTFGGVKLILDGSPQGKTAFMTQPYAVPPDGQDADYRGYPTLPPARVDALLETFLDARVPVIAHANGDAAADLLIDAVRKAAPAWDHRTVMIHAQTVREDQLDAMVDLGMVPSFFSAHTFYWGDWHRDSVFGAARASRISPTRSALDRGLPFTVHNDAPIVPPDMIRLLWATTNRVTRSGRVLGAAQRIPTLAALRAMTIDAARQHFVEDEKGTLTPGKLADLVVLSGNPLDLPPPVLLELTVLRTVARGREVYVAGDGP